MKMIEYQIRITFTRLLAILCLVCAMITTIILKDSNIMLTTIPALSGLVAIDNWVYTKRKPCKQD